jgi:hypothetical protein
LFEIRDDRGERVDAQVVTLRLFRFANAGEAQKWRTANAIAGDAQEYWIVSFASMPPNEEPSRR